LAVELRAKRAKSAKPLLAESLPDALRRQVKGRAEALPDQRGVTDELRVEVHEMRIALGLVVCLGFLVTAGVFAGPEKTGTIRGVVRFTGKVPPAKQLPTGDGGMIEHHDLVVEPKTKGLRWVIAALEDAPAQPKLDEGETPVLMDQKDMLFIPRVIAVQHGRPVRFDNSDNINHSVTIFSAVKENNINGFVTARDPIIKGFSAEKAPLKVGCVLHPSMTAWIFVAPHPWVAVSDETGAFTIGEVPPGKYKLLLRHPDTGLFERRDVVVKAGEAIKVEVEWKEPRPKK
jgi:plastocyanin